MWDLTRRQFLKQTSIGAGVAVGAAAAVPHLFATPSAGPTPSTDPLPSLSLSGMSVSEPMLMHVRDMATAEIAVFVGTQELVYRAPDLVARLVQTAKQAAETEG
jgi:hypothetical protein